MTNIYGNLCWVFYYVHHLPVWLSMTQHVRCMINNRLLGNIMKFNHLNSKWIRVSMVFRPLYSSSPKQTISSTWLLFSFSVDASCLLSSKSQWKEWMKKNIYSKRKERKNMRRNSHTIGCRIQGIAWSYILSIPVAVQIWCCSWWQSPADHMKPQTEF